MSGYKKYYIGIAAIIALCCCFLYIADSELAAASNKYHSYYINDIYGDVMPLDGNNIKEKLSIETDIYGLLLNFVGKGTFNGEISVLLYNKSSVRVAKASINATEIASGKYTPVLFEQAVLNSPEKEYFLQIIAPPETGLLLQKNSETNELALGVIDDISGGFIYNYYFVFFTFCLLCFVLLYCFAFIKTLKPEKLFLLATLALFIPYNMALPPYSAPDEQAHINSSYLLSNKIVGIDKTAPYGFVSKRISDNSQLLQQQNTTVFSYKYISANLLQPPEKELVAENSWVVSDFPVVYIIPALSMIASRFFGCSFLAMLYFARAANLIFYSICIYYAIKKAPIGKEIFLVLALLPINLHLANSFSRDNFVISLSFLLISNILYLLYEKESYSYKNIAFLAVICALLAPSKFIYFPLCLLPFILPASKFKGLKFSGIFYKLGIGALTAATFIFQYGNVVVRYFGYFIGLFMLTAKAASQEIVTETALAIIEADSITFSIYQIIETPVLTAKVIINSLYQNGYYYLKSVVGGVLSYNSIIISDVFVFGFMLLIFVSVFNMTAEEKYIHKQDKMAFFAVFTLVVSLIIFVTLEWTPTYYTTLYGLQGKYFIPVIPLLLLTLKNRIFTASTEIINSLAFFAVTLNCFVLLNAVVVILKR